jgi:predicted GNAT superfamily acetyltransferase
MAGEIQIRECATIAEFDACIKLQRDVFALPDLEISPRRHLIVSRQAGGWTLGAFVEDQLVGFVHHLVAAQSDAVAGYSHMMAVAVDFQNKGVGAQLKWAQRKRALNEGRKFIKWTWEPMRARNAHFNLNLLGAIVEEYAENFYGTDYLSGQAEQSETAYGIDSDRLFASWHLSGDRVTELAQGRKPGSLGLPAQSIAIPGDWMTILREDKSLARSELLRVRKEFKRAFAAGLVCAGFDRDQAQPRYLLYSRSQL